LVETADVVIETPSGGHGLSYEALAAINPRLILATLTPFGLDGPFASCPASDLEITASSGSLWLAGEASEPPVRTSEPQSPSWTGMYAAAGVLTAVLARESTGHGQHIDVSAQASMVTAISQAPIFWDLLGEEQHRSGPFLVGRSVTGARFRNVWPCRDGYITFALYGGQAGRDTGRALVAWMDEITPSGAPPVLRALDWDAFDVATASQDQVEEIEAAIGPFFLGLSKSEFFSGVLARNMLGYPLSTAEDMAADVQLAGRGFWQPVASLWNGEICAPGSFALFDGQRPPLRRTAPGLGEHNAEIYRDELGLTVEDVAALRSAGVV
jgi:crotonobetainyl-CoA:carnitine CoA-transferase CaiB-like acyl-CoA transferase